MKFDFSMFKDDIVKEESRKMYELCIKRAESIGKADYLRTGGRISLVDMYKDDMLHFLVYITYADGMVSPEELEFINSLTGNQFYLNTLAFYASKLNLTSERFLEKPPRSLEAFVRSNIGPETGEISSRYYDLIMLYITTFNYIGNDIISCNQDIKRGELECLSAYINMLRKNVDLINSKIEEDKPTIAFKSSKAENNDAEEDKSEFTRFIKETRFNNDYEDKSAATVINNNNDRYNYRLNKNKIDNDSEKQDNKNVVDSDTIDLEKIMEELNSLTGMQSVKKEVNNIVNLLKVCELRKKRGLKIPPTTNHLVFLGNPGTGKTTVARILSKIYCNLGILSKGHLIEVDRSGLVAGYMGQTSEKVMEVIEKAKGGVLFIDEAYALTSNKQDGDFGQEAVDILNKAMEDYRDDLIVIAAGYHDEMQDFLDANPGLRSRFNRTIDFPDYTAEELIEIISNRAKKLDYMFDDGVLELIKEKFSRTLIAPPENFGNARSVRNYLEKAISNQANRLMSGTDIDEDKLMTITKEDVENLVLK